jgi:tight adherence protein C
MAVLALSGMGALAIVAVAAGIALVVYQFLNEVQDRSEVRSSLRQLQTTEVENVRERELLAPLRERAVDPVLTGLVALGRRFTPIGYAQQVRRKLIAAGMPTADTLDRFLALRVLTVALVPVSALLVWFLVPASAGLRLALMGLITLVLLLGPDAVLNRRVEARAYALRQKLPDILDLLVISVEAGLGFEQALERTVATVPGPMATEFSRMLGEVRAGATRADALRHMEQRTDVPEMRSFVLALLQADTFGVSIGRVLRTQADELRVKRRQLAQERAQKAPVKMLIPMIFCVFPALFVVVLGPAVIDIYNNI